MLLPVLSFAHHLLRSHLQNGDIAVDATMGNGHDTLFLAQCVGENGRVFAMDIQETALAQTEKKLLENQLLHRVSLLKMGHEHMANHVPQGVSAMVFNFGYLPHGNHAITTLPETSLRAVQSGLNLLKTKGLMVLVIYHGHEMGQHEAVALLDYAQNLPQKQFRVLKYDFINQTNRPPFVIAIQKLTDTII